MNNGLYFPEWSCLLMKRTGWTEFRWEDSWLEWYFFHDCDTWRRVETGPTAHWALVIRRDLGSSSQLGPLFLYQMLCKHFSCRFLYTWTVSGKEKAIEVVFGLENQKESSHHKKKEREAERIKSFLQSGVLLKRIREGL